MTGQPKESVSRGVWICLHGVELLAGIMKEKCKREVPAHSDAHSIRTCSGCMMRLRIDWDWKPHRAGADPAWIMGAR